MLLLNKISKNFEQIKSSNAVDKWSILSLCTFRMPRHMFFENSQLSSHIHIYIYSFTYVCSYIVYVYVFNEMCICKYFPQPTAPGSLWNSAILCFIAFTCCFGLLYSTLSNRCHHNYQRVRFSKSVHITVGFFSCSFTWLFLLLSVN